LGRRLNAVDVSLGVVAKWMIAIIASIKGQCGSGSFQLEAGVFFRAIRNVRYNHHTNNPGYGSKDDYAQH